MERVNDYYQYETVWSEEELPSHIIELLEKDYWTLTPEEYRVLTSWIDDNTDKLTDATPVHDDWISDPGDGDICYDTIDLEEID